MLALVEERKISGEHMIFVEKCKDPKSVTIFVRGGNEQVVDEAERSITDVIGAVTSAVVDGKYVTGGGSIEIDVANGLRNYCRQRRRKGAARDPEVRGRARGHTKDPLRERRNGRDRHPGAA